MRWKKVGSLIVPDKQPEKPLPTIKKAAYRTQHTYCPECGSDNIESTCMGMLGKDTNSASCLCGWHGIVDDLVPAQVKLKRTN